MILLHILKIIGIILLVLLLILCTVVLLLLFVPVTYRASGSIRQGFRLKGSVNVLCHLAGVYFYTEDDMQEAYVRILWFKKPLFQAEDTDRELEEEISSAVKEEVKEAEDTLEELLLEEPPIEKHLERSQTSAGERAAEEHGKKWETEDPKKASDTQQESSSFGGHAKRERTFFSKLREFSGKLGYRIENLGRAITNFRDFTENPVHRAAFGRLKEAFIRLLEAVAPSKLKLHAKFSTGAPDTTGILLGVIALFPAAYQNRWVIVPDFETDRMYVEADFDVRGHIFCYQILGILLRIFFDSDCRRLYHDLRVARESE